MLLAFLVDFLTPTVLRHVACNNTVHRTFLVNHLIFFKVVLSMFN